MSANYRLLLSEAARLYEKHETRRPDPFNVFSVLRRETDEVHLHSRFLHALLDYRSSPDNPRKNLADFLRSVIHINNFDPDRATVDRESDNIDILIRDPSSRQAVVIENKIEAGDQPLQLWRYAKKQKKQGYTPHLRYLTLHGHSPSEDSAGDSEYECISYKEDLPPWLKRCQKRAYDEPALRESVAQYLHLIEKLTGKNYSEAYMKELKELCLREDNLGLVYDLKEAMNEVHVFLLQKLWQEIKGEINDTIDDLPKQQEDTFEGKIEAFVNGQRGTLWKGLYYKLKSGRFASLGIGVGDPICFGVKCPKEEGRDEYIKLKGSLEGGYSDASWPWYDNPDIPLNPRNPTRKDLKLLANEEERKKYVKKLVCNMSELWEQVKKVDLT